MAFFPASPTDGQQANVGNITYQFNAATGAWNRVGTTITQLVDGTLVTISGNLIVSGSGTSQFTNNLNVINILTVSGNVVGANLITSGNVSAGNIAATGVISSSGQLSGASISTPGAITATGQISTASTLTASGQINGARLVTSGNVTVGGDIIGGGGMTLPGSIQVANIISLGTVTATGNVSGSYLVGNGFYLTGLPGGGGAGNRANVSASTGSIANTSTYNGTVVMAKGYVVYKVTTTAAAWVRAYTSIASRTADASRTIDQDPQPGAGVIVEVITTGANTVLISPSAVGFNDESPVSNVVPISITNISGGTANVGVTFTYLGLEL